jgi:hypothetical protein
MGKSCTLSPTAQETRNQQHADWDIRYWVKVGLISVFCPCGGHEPPTQFMAAIHALLWAPSSRKSLSNCSSSLRFFLVNDPSWEDTVLMRFRDKKE